MKHILQSLLTTLTILAAGCSLSVDVDTAVTCMPTTDCGEDRECVGGFCQAIADVPDAADLPDASAPMIDAMLGPDATPTRMLIRSVLTLSDDAEEHLSVQATRIDSTSLEIGLDDGVTPQRVGIRFQDIEIPAGSTILDARIQFTVETASGGTINAVVTAQRDDNAGTFTIDVGNLTARTKTNASVSWTPDPWPTVTATGPDQLTTNLAPLVTEVIGLAGWASGNAIVFLLDGDGGVREATTFETGPPATLTIEYQLP